MEVRFCDERMSRLVSGSIHRSCSEWNFGRCVVNGVVVIACRWEVVSSMSARRATAVVSLFLDLTSLFRATPTYMYITTPAISALFKPSHYSFKSAWMDDDTKWMMGGAGQNVARYRLDEAATAIDTGVRERRQSKQRPGKLH